MELKVLGLGAECNRFIGTVFLSFSLSSSVMVQGQAKEKGFIFNNTILSMKNKVEIRNVFRTYEEAWNLNDIEAWGELFTTDTDFITWSGAWFRSNQVNVENHQKAHDKLKEMGQNMTYNLQLESIDLIKDDTALVHATWYWPFFKIEDSVEDRKGILTMLMIKNEGEWLIRTTQNTRID
ncbi:MAG: hypothetical protein CML04_01525 [Pseudozobellia sp.]|nr:hypothetical protein [Pseudozobellia sp.]MBG48863.1 hypothetical protein [Pseudozobellia sp.]